MAKLSASLLEVDHKTCFRNARCSGCWCVTNTHDTCIHRLSRAECCQSTVKVIHGTRLNVVLLHVDVSGRANIDTTLDEVLELFDVITAITDKRCSHQWVACYMECLSGVGLRLTTNLTLDGECN